MKGKAKRAAKAVGMCLYDWFADAIREKLYRQGLVERYVLDETGDVVDTKTGDRLETAEQVYLALSAAMEGR